MTYLISLLRLNVPNLLEIQQKNGRLDEEDVRAVEAFKDKMKQFVQTKCPKAQLWCKIKDITVSILLSSPHHIAI